MHITDLIRQFAGVGTLPVDVNDVLATIRSAGYDDNIEFIGVDLDPDVLLGKIEIFYTRPNVYGDPVRNANIYYHRGWGTDWQRLICCKELLHLLDPTWVHTCTAEDIDKLAEKIGLPPEMQDPLSDGLATNVDRLAEFRAAAILLPKASRDDILPYLKEGKVTLADVARMADIPRKYAGMIMSDYWVGLHEALIAR